VVEYSVRNSRKNTRVKYHRTFLASTSSSVELSVGHNPGKGWSPSSHAHIDVVLTRPAFSESHNPFAALCKSMDVRAPNSRCATI
jgi:hypothetical protein